MLVLFLQLPAIKSWLNRAFRKSLNIPKHQYTIKEGNCTEKILCTLTVAKIIINDKKVRAFFTSDENKMSLWSLQLKWVSRKLFEIQLNCLHFLTKVEWNYGVHPVTRNFSHLGAITITNHREIELFLATGCTL